MRSTAVDVAIIGAGPYGLSLAAHLGVGKLSYRIFGTPMSSWRNHMLTRTWLKSDGFASQLVRSRFRLYTRTVLPGAIASLCRRRSPVPIETFVAYGLEVSETFVANSKKPK